MEVVSKKLQDNIKLIKDKFGDENKEVVVKNMKVLGRNAAVVYMVGLADTQTLAESVIRPCMLATGKPTQNIEKAFNNNVHFESAGKVIKLKLLKANLSSEYNTADGVITINYNHYSAKITDK